MEDNQNVDRRFYEVVEAGDVERLRQLIHSHRHPSADAVQYRLIREAVKNRHLDVVKLLLTNYPRMVNSKNIPPSDTPLHFAVGNGDLEIIEMLLQRGAEISAINDNRKTPFELAIRSNKIEIVELFLMHIVDINKKIRGRMTFLDILLHDCCEEIVQFPLKTIDCVKFSQSSCGPSLLHCAVESGNVQIVEMLIEKGAEANATFEGKTPLHKAKNIEVAEILLKHGASVNATDRDGNQPIHCALLQADEETITKLLFGVNLIEHPDFLLIAARSGRKAIVEALLQIIDVNSKDREGVTALHISAEAGFEEIITLLLSKGANICAKTKLGWTALHFASKGDHEKIVELLLENGSPVDITTEASITPLHLAAENSSLRVIESLLKFHADVNLRDNLGETTLHKAVRSKEPKIVETFLELIPDINSTNVNRKSPLDIAIQLWHLDSIKAILKFGGSVDLRGYDGRTVLQVAAGKTDIEAFAAFLSLGADVNLVDNRGRTLIHIIVEQYYFNYEIFEKVLKLSSDLNATDNEGDTALHLAIKYGFRNPSAKFMDILLKFGPNVSIQNKLGRTALHNMAQNCRLKYEIFERVLKLSTNINTTDNNGDTALHLAVKSGRKEKFREKYLESMLKFGADVNLQDKIGRTVLHTLAANRDFKFEIFEKVLVLSADLNATDNYGDTALHLAVRREFQDKFREKYVESMLKFGADVNLQDKRGRAVLHTLAANLDFKFEIFEKVLKLTADLNATDENGDSALHLALHEQNMYRTVFAEYVEGMIKFGANLNLKNKLGRAALHIAAERGNVEIVEVFLKFGASVNLQDHVGRTVLHIFSTQYWACNNNNTFSKILKFGVDINAKADSGDTALHLAAGNIFMNPKNVESMLELGADVNVTNNKGKTALHNAVERRISGTINLLLDYGSDITVRDCAGYTPLEYRKNDLAEISSCYFYKMQTVGMFVSETYLPMINWFQWMFPHMILSCKQEIELMKTEVLLKKFKISVYDILTKKTRSLGMIMRNEDIVESLIFDHKVKYPLYCGIIKVQIKKGLNRKDLLDEAYAIFNCISKFHLPLYCTDEIASYLDKDDLQNLAFASTQQ